MQEKDMKVKQLSYITNEEFKAMTYKEGGDLEVTEGS